MITSRNKKTFYDCDFFIKLIEIVGYYMSRAEGRR